MSACRITEIVLANLFFFTAFFTIIFSITSKVGFVLDLKDKKRNLPKYYAAKALFYLSMTTPPPWIDDKNLLKRHKKITFYVPLALFSVMIILVVLGIAMDEYCDE